MDLNRARIQNLIPGELKPKVAIIILVWNDYENTKECLESCALLSYENLQVIVIDNASLDRCCQRLSVEFPWAEFLFNEENLGYAAGNNIGIQRALESGAEYVFVMNNDIVVESKNLVEEMVDRFNTIPALGILAPHILQLTSAGNYIPVHYECRLYDFIKKYFLNNGQYNRSALSGSKIMEQTVVSGCAIMLNRELITKVGYFNKEFFMFGEEDDLCLRAARAGLLVANLNDDRLTVKHKGGASYSGLPPWKAFLSARNRFLQLPSFSLCAQSGIVAIHFMSVCRLTFLIIKKGELRAGLGYILGFLAGLSFWCKDILGLSRQYEYLIQARNVATGKSLYARLLNIGLRR